jgi:hypothetical protein
MLADGGGIGEQRVGRNSRGDRRNGARARRMEHCGFLSLEILERMGFRIVAAEAGSGFGNPIGLDGVFEASFCPTSQVL